MPNAPSPALTAPTLAANVMHFARLLRRAGLPVGPAETLAAQQALSLIELGDKAETRTALRSVMTHRHEHQEVFDQAFALFWRDPTAAEQAAAMALLEAQKEKKLERPPPASRRVAEAMQQKRDHHARIERRLAEPTHVAARDLLEIQALPHQPNDKPRNVVLGHEILHTRRQKQRLIDIPGAKMLAHSPRLNQTR